MYSRIVGTGSYLPEKIVTNFDLEQRMDTSDAWIRERTGIERRHIAPEGNPMSTWPNRRRARRFAAAGLKPGDSI